MGINTLLLLWVKWGTEHEEEKGNRDEWTAGGLQLIVHLIHP